jgi:ROK family protein
VTLHLGLDLGGTNVKWALVEGARLVAAGSAPTLAHEGPARVVERLAEIGGAALDGARADSVGVGLPGVFDADSGTAVFLPNLPGDWAGEPVAGPLSAALGAPAVLVNDARAFAVGEAQLGAARGCRTRSSSPSGRASAEASSSTAACISGSGPPVSSGTRRSLRTGRCAGAAAGAASRPSRAQARSRPQAGWGPSRRSSRRRGKGSRGRATRSSWPVGTSGSPSPTRFSCSRPSGSSWRRRRRGG